jgi:DNA gyrase subunit A
MSLDVTRELGQNFIEYAAAVNTDRSIPDAKSGLKPVARRILFGAFDTGRSSSKPYVKNARIVGDVMGSLHPHGDSSIYGALVRLSQPWVMRYPLMDFHGNQGSINGDGPAAMRYTEGRLAKLAEDGMLKALKKNCVDMMPTYDDSAEEPITLPAIFPNLLCNPNSGIGVAMACNWACHNLREVQDAILAYMNGEEPMLPGPDFPTGGIIINKNDIPSIMKTGHGSVKIRAKYEVKKNVITVTEIPYGTTVEGLLTEIGAFADENPTTGIKDVKDQTNNKGVKIVIECENSASPEVIMQKLFSKTNLQSSFSYNQVALVDKVPTELNLKDCCKVYVEHNIECIVREAQFDLDKAQARLHIVDGLLKALEDIDNIIALIKKSASAADAKVALIDKYKFSDEQAKAILAMRLSSLANLEKIELQNEKADLQKAISELTALINTEELQKTELKNRLAEIVKKYGDERKTELAQVEIAKEEKEIQFVEPEKCVVVITEGGSIKRIPTASFRTQKRNGKGVKTQDDIVEAVIRTNTIDSLMIFTNQGRMYRILVDNIPVGTNAAKGTSIHSLVEMQAGETPSVIYSIYRDTDAQYVLFVTKNGLVKKTPLDEYIKTKKKTGIAAIAIKDGDELASVSLVKDEDVILLTSGGMGIRFNTMEVAPTSRSTSGVKGITLKDNDFVTAAMPVRHPEDQVAVFVKSGLGKKFPMGELPVQKRAGKGLICYKPTDTTGPVTAGALLSDEDAILLIGEKTSICIAATDVPSLSRGSIGNQLIKNGKICSVSKV